MYAKKLLNENQFFIKVRQPFISMFFEIIDHSLKKNTFSMCRKICFSHKTVEYMTIYKRSFNDNVSIKYNHTIPFIKYFTNKPAAETVVFLFRSAVQNHSAPSKPAAAPSDGGGNPLTGLNFVLDR